MPKLKGKLHITVPQRQHTIQARKLESPNEREVENRNQTPAAPNPTPTNSSSEEDVPERVPLWPQEDSGHWSASSSEESSRDDITHISYRFSYSDDEADLDQEVILENIEFSDGELSGYVTDEEDHDTFSNSSSSQSTSLDLSSFRARIYKGLQADEDQSFTASGETGSSWGELSEVGSGHSKSSKDSSEKEKVGEGEWDSGSTLSFVEEGSEFSLPDDYQLPVRRTTSGFDVEDDWPSSSSEESDSSGASSIPENRSVISEFSDQSHFTSELSDFHYPSLRDVSEVAEKDSFTQISSLGSGFSFNGQTQFKFGDDTQSVSSHVSVDTCDTSYIRAAAPSSRKKGCKNRNNGDILQFGNFKALPKELGLSGPLQVKGKVPENLKGVYIRNGPNSQFEEPHWHCGDGMLHAVEILQGKVRYRNRYIRTTEFMIEKAEHRPIWSVETYAGVSHLWSMMKWKLWGVLGKSGFVKTEEIPFFKNPANMSLVYHAGRLLALGEVGTPYEIAVPSLGTVSPVAFGNVWDFPVCAHPKVDPNTHEMFLFGYKDRKSVV